MTSAKEDLLDPLQAALHLAITPELLFGYTRPGFRRNSEDSRRLETVHLGGKTLFSRPKLDEFDAYLKEAWAPAGSPRSDPPKCILDHLRAESGNQCARCGSGIGVQTAHIDPWATSRSHHPLNLIRLCSRCHVEHDIHKSVSTEELRSLKNGLIARMRALTMRRLEPVASRFRPPPPTGKFVGYADELAGLRRGLQSGRSIFVLGVAGIGKTQLALRVLQDIGTGRPVVWIPVESYGSPTDVLLALESAVSEGQPPQDKDGLAKRLDELQACVVFDGIERVGAAFTDQFEDILARLVESTTRVQFLFTSQLMFQRVPADGSVRLSRLSPDASSLLLNRSIVQVSGVAPDAEVELLSFCDGHPLTIRLVGALVDFFGSGETALARIQARGSRTIALQGRSSHDGQTSLDLSLSLAYEALGPAEKKLLWLVGNAPAGLLLAHLEIGDGFGLEDPILAVAHLRRWSLIRSIHAGQPHERLYVLSPVRSFVTRRWREQYPDEAESSLQRLLFDFAMLAKVVDDRASDSEGIGYMVERFRDELPNLLKVVEVACRRPSDDHLSMLAFALCGSLMRYFFLLGFSEKGTEVMRQAVDLAMRREEYVYAADFVVRLLVLAKRAEDSRAAEAAAAILELVEQRLGTGESAATADIAMAKSMMALDAGNAQNAELFADRAVRCLEAQMRDRSGESAANDLSSALSLLGDARSAQHKYAEAEVAYTRALELGSASHLTVNRGQVLHQLGNAAAYQRKWVPAAECYVEAAQHFYQVGMHEYLGNALGELGFVALEIDGIDVSESVLSDGLVDVANSVVRTFGSDIRRGSAHRPAVLRKFIGTVALASFLTGSPTLRGFSARLRRRLEDIWKDSVEEIQDGEILLLHGVLTIAEGVESMVELSDQKGDATRSTIEKVASGVHILGEWGRDLGTFKWFACYLSRRWGRADITEYTIWSAFEEAERTGVFSLD